MFYFNSLEEKVTPLFYPVLLSNSFFYEIVLALALGNSLSGIIYAVWLDIA